MRVVVTRPQISAVRTAERLKAMGHDPILLPLSRAVHHSQAAGEALGEPYSAIAVTSSEALRVLAAAPIHRLIDVEKPLFAVGEATAEAARSLGFRNVRAGSGDGAELADLIAAETTTTATPLLYLAGRPRAKTFETRLAELGLAWRIAEIYEMTAVEYTSDDIADSLMLPPAEAVLLYSRETAIRFFDLVPADLGPIRLLCISERVASAIPAAFRPHVEIAETPGEDALLALL